jgi:hypothetical protein
MERHNQPVTDYEEVGGRPRISQYANVSTTARCTGLSYLLNWLTDIEGMKAPRFEVGDQVWLINQFGDREGPYLVSSPPEGGQCTLCELDWQTPVRNNELVSLDYLEKAA